MNLSRIPYIYGLTFLRFVYGLTFRRPVQVFFVVVNTVIVFDIFRRSVRWVKQKRLGDGNELRDNRKCYKIPKGLPNLWNTCYMNSVLQVLCWTPGLAEALAERRRRTSSVPRSFSKFVLMKLRQCLPFGQEEENQVETDVTEALLDLIHVTKLSSEPVSRNVPFRILQEVRKINSQFDGNHQQDSYELLNTIISGIDDESQVSGTSEAQDDKSVIQSAVSKMFGGFFVIAYRYQTCSHIEPIFQRFTSIPVPVANQIASGIDSDITQKPVQGQTSFTEKREATGNTGIHTKLLYQDETRNDKGDNRKDDVVNAGCQRNVIDGSCVENDDESNIKTPGAAYPSVTGEGADVQQDGSPHESSRQLDGKEEENISTQEMTANPNTEQTDNTDGKCTVDTNTESDGFSSVTHTGCNDMTQPHTQKREATKYGEENDFKKDNNDGEYINDFDANHGEARSFYLTESGSCERHNVDDNNSCTEHDTEHQSMETETGDIEMDTQEDCEDVQKSDENTLPAADKSTSDTVMIKEVGKNSQAHNDQRNDLTDSDETDRRCHEMQHDEENIGEKQENALAKEENNGEEPMHKCFQALREVSSKMTGIELGLQELTTVEEFDEDVIGCRICRPGELITKKRLLVLQPPEILILQINKFKQEFTGLVKMDVDVTYTKYLTMAPFCSNAMMIPEIRSEIGSSGTIYSLYGVVSHVGTLQGGHYTSYVSTDSEPKQFVPENYVDSITRFWNDEKPPEIEKKVENISTWYHINDMTVTKCKEKDAIENRDAYILFYKKVKGQ